MMPVNYQAIDGLPGYRVGDDGSVWSQLGHGSRHAKGKLTGEWRLLKPCTRRYGHKYVTLSRPDGGKDRRPVHRLVLSAFVGPCPAGFEGCHADGNAANNTVANLRWDTHAQNMSDRAKHGTLSGEKHGRAVLSSRQAEEIRARFASGERIAALAREYGISESQGHRVAKGQQWKPV